MDSLIKYLSFNAAAMPWLVMRASELWNWYSSGEYDRILHTSDKWNYYRIINKIFMSCIHK